MMISDPKIDYKFMPSDNENDLLPEEMVPLTKLSRDGVVYIVRAEYKYEFSEGFVQMCVERHCYVRRSKAIDEIETLLNDVGFDRIIYLSLDVYFDEFRSRLSSVVIVDKREGVK